MAKVNTAAKTTTETTSESNGRKAPDISRLAFKAQAKPIAANIAGSALYLDAKEFSTGSYGFGYSGKITVVIDGTPVKCQASINITVVNSKESK